MVQVHELVYNNNKDERIEKKVVPSVKMSNINDNMDVVIEILKRLDDRSLGVAACVCRLWCAMSRNEALWEYLCFRHRLSPEGVRTVVGALGGYRRLYMLCVKPVMLRVERWSRHEVDLSLSLFCVDYYERLFLPRDSASPPPPSSLMLLRKAVNV